VTRAGAFKLLLQALVLTPEFARAALASGACRFQLRSESFDLSTQTGEFLRLCGGRTFELLRLSLARFIEKPLRLDFLFLKGLVLLLQSAELQLMIRGALRLRGTQLREFTSGLIALADQCLRARLGLFGLCQTLFKVWI
jgi:hypothetical protein